MSSNDGWIRPALFFLAVSAAATGIAVVIAATRGSSTSTPAPATTTAATTPAKTVRTTTTAPTTTAQKPPARPRPPAAGAWPAGTSGYTDVLQSIPVASGRAVALAGAHAAARAGLPRPGVLVSSRYATLHPGYYVVFSGVYRTSAAAAAALATVHARGFPGAYQVRVARTG
ncbi:MAG TPA: hypothetical protein VMT74_02560 [Gaiellaceae bacterium]|nr:hypothetical protein [Gaiellaceae bacterium]